MRLNCALCQFSRSPTHLSVRHPTDTHNCFRYRNFGITAASANRRRRKSWNRSRLPSVDCRPSCAVEVIGTPAHGCVGNPGRMTSEAHTGRRSTGDGMRVQLEPYTGASRCFSPADMAGCRTWRVKARYGRNGAAESTARFLFSSRRIVRVRIQIPTWSAARNSFDHVSAIREKLRHVVVQRLRSGLGRGPDARRLSNGADGRRDDRHGRRAPPFDLSDVAHINTQLGFTLHVSMRRERARVGLD